MLGHLLLDELSKEPGLETQGTIRSLSQPSSRRAHGPRIHPGVEAEDFATVEAVVESMQPDVLINCIGIVKQRPEARDPIALLEANTLLPHRLARLCTTLNRRLVHFSTDCVFSGRKGCYREDDTPDAMDFYGRSKLLGEPTTPTCLTLRTSILGHELDRRLGLLEWFLSGHDRVPGFRRVYFSGLPSLEIARVLRDYVLPRPDLSGIYHLTSSPISKFELLQLIAKEYGVETVIEPTSTPEFDRSLDGRRFAEATEYHSPPWPRLVSAMHRDAQKRYVRSALSWGGPKHLAIPDGEIYDLP